MNKKSTNLKGLFKHHKIKNVNFGSRGREYFSQIWNDAKMFKIIYFGSEYGLDSTECCKSKDGTCATIECPHNYRRYGSDVYEHYRELTKE